MKLPVLRLIGLFAGLVASVSSLAQPMPVTLNQLDDGYRGIWYLSEKPATNTPINIAED